MKKNILLSLGVFAFSASYCLAATVIYDNTSGDRLFSTAANWDTDTVPVNSDVVFVQAPSTQANPALVDSLFTANALATVNVLGGGYATIQAGATLQSSNLALGAQDINISNSGGHLLVNAGGSLNTAANNSGVFSIGIGASNSTLVLESGVTSAIWPNLNLGSNGTLQFVADSSGFGGTVVDLRGNNAWTMDGVLSLDLSSLSSIGTWTLMTHENDDTAGESMVGALRTQLDNASGTITGSGAGTNGALEIIGYSGNWELNYSETSGAGVLEFTATSIPEANAYGLLAGFLALTWVMVRRRS